MLQEVRLLRLRQKVGWQKLPDMGKFSPPIAGVANRRLVTEAKALKEAPVECCEAVPRYDDVMSM